MIPLVLASRSAKRIELLRREGVAFEAIEAPTDDPAAAPSGDARESAVRIAQSKARAVLRTYPRQCQGRAILAADTLCEMAGRAVGKPQSREEARDMLELAFRAPHRVVTGVCVLHGPREWTFFDEAVVTIGRASEAQVLQHLVDGSWCGRAGGYDLAELRSRGWRIHCDGDPDTVAGLPWRRVRECLDQIEKGSP